jgi:hypothetical protein
MVTWQISFLLLFVPFGAAFQPGFNQSIWCGREAIYPAVRGFPVTFKTLPVFQMILVPGEYTSKILHAHHPFVASYAIGLHCNLSGFSDVDHLGFAAHGKNCGMAKPVLSLEEVFAEKIVVRYMTIIAGSHIPVRAVGPVTVLGVHYMTIDTCFGIIR